MYKAGTYSTYPNRLKAVTAAKDPPTKYYYYGVEYLRKQDT